MINNRIYTFLKLCEVMNYHKTAELLNMTQPAVTQHIHYLEDEYNCKLFEYSKKQLIKTQKCIELEKYARSVIYNELSFKSKLKESPKTKLSIGATKTIGEYYIEDKILSLLDNSSYEINFIIDNTEQLLKKLNSLEVDFLLIEGYFNKNTYSYKSIKAEELVGICSKKHKFANKAIELTDILKEHLILREYGSGTRAVFEQFLLENNLNINSFENKSFISSFKIIKEAIQRDYGISFVYESIANSNTNLSKFTFNNKKVLHEFNFVYLKNTNVDKYIYLLN